MLPTDWQYIAAKSRQISYNIHTGDEVDDQTRERLIHIVDKLDIKASDTLNSNYEGESHADIHTYAGGRQVITTQHSDGTIGRFDTDGTNDPTDKMIDIEISHYMNSRIDESNTRINMKQKKTINEAQLRNMIAEVIKEIGDTPAGEWMLGRLAGRQRNRAKGEQRDGKVKSTSVDARDYARNLGLENDVNYTDFSDYNDIDNDSPFMTGHNLENRDWWDRNGWGTHRADCDYSNMIDGYAKAMGRIINQQRNKKTIKESQLRAIVSEAVNRVLRESMEMSLSEKVYSILADEGRKEADFQSARLSEYGISDKRIYDFIETACKRIAETASEIFAEYERNGYIKPPFRRGSSVDYEQTGL